MDKRFLIQQINICECNIVDGVYKFKMDEYTNRWCVLDTLTKDAIDINMRLRYKFIPTLNETYFLDDSYKKVKHGERVAINPYYTFDIPNDIKNQAIDITDNIKAGYIYLNGNEMLDNDAYIEIIKEEKEPKQKIKRKIWKKVK